jgi:hypothetical protein
MALAASALRWDHLPLGLVPAPRDTEPRDLKNMNGSVVPNVLPYHFVAICFGKLCTSIYHLVI